MTTLKSAQSVESRNQTDKPHYTAENVNVIQNINILKQEAAQLKEDSESFSKNLESIKSYNEKAEKNCKNLNQ
jgi:hypothetical protein